MNIRNCFKIHLAYILLLTLIFNVIICAGNSNEREDSSITEITPKVKVIRRVRNLLTDFLTEEQLTQFIDTYLGMYLDGSTFQEIQDDVLANAMDMLDDEQLLKALGAYKKASKVLGMDKIMAVGMTCIEVLTNNMTPFVNQILAKVQIMKEQNKGKNSINNNIFLMANQFFTKKRARTIFKRIMNKIGKEDFQLAYPFLSDFLKFDLISDLI